MAEETARARAIRMRGKIGKAARPKKGGTKLTLDRRQPINRGLEEMPRMESQIPSKSSAPAIDAINKRPPEWGGAPAAPKKTGRANALTRGRGKKLGLTKPLPNKLTKLPQRPVSGMAKQKPIPAEKGSAALIKRRGK